MPEPYADAEQFKDWIGDPLDVDDEKIEAVLDDVSREIESFCSRSFHRADEPSARTFEPLGCELWIDDAWTTDGLEVDGHAWPAPGMTLLPRNGVVDGIDGWPYTRIRRGGGWAPEVTVTARWGWAEVPAPVYQACLILAAEGLKLKDSPFGVGGYGEWGIVRVRDNPHAARRLMRYQRDLVVVG